MAVLLIAEHDNQVLGHDTLKAMGAAGSLSGGIDVLVAGVHCQKVAEQASRIAGVQRVLVADSTVYEHQLAENLSALVAEIGGKYTHIVAAATTFGKNLLPRVAALLDVGMLSDVIAIESDDTVVRPIYAGNALARVKSNDAVKILTVRGSAFDTAAERSEGTAEIASLDIEISNDVSRFVGRESADSARPELSAARIVVSGGRGLGNKENFALIEKLADKLGAAIGASRAAVDAGFVSNDLQVGQTGKIVAPDLYIAVGISGAIQHLAGMKDSKVIVAINSDPEAPIFDIADYGLVGDLFEILPQLIDAV